jgi:hypothetical protein
MSEEQQWEAGEAVRQGTEEMRLCSVTASNVATIVWMTVTAMELWMILTDSIDRK